MLRIALCSLLLVGACSKKSDAPAGKNENPSTAPGGAPGGYLTVGTYCNSFCGKLCSTCGNATCPDSCKPRCLYGRSPEMVLDGKDPKVALALTQKELDACTALITKDSCLQIAGGQVPPACFTIQH